MEQIENPMSQAQPCETSMETRDVLCWCSNCEREETVYDVDVEWEEPHPFDEIQEGHWEPVDFTPPQCCGEEME